MVNADMFWITTNLTVIILPFLSHQSDLHPEFFRTAIKLSCSEIPVVVMALSQLSANPGQEGRQRTRDWNAAGALMDDSRWKSLTGVWQEKATDPTPPRPGAERKELLSVPELER